jgi:hypothetical protein
MQLNANGEKLYANGQVSIIAYAPGVVESSDTHRMMLVLNSPAHSLTLASYINNDVYRTYIQIQDADQQGIIFNAGKHDLDFNVYGNSTDAHAVLGVDAGANKIRTVFYTPASDTDAGLEGHIALDANYIYVHNGTIWKRVALGGF